MARAAASLGTTGGPVAFRDASTPHAVAVDLAIQLAGRRGVPLTLDEPLPAGVAAEPDLPPTRSRLERWSPEPWPAAPPSTALGGERSADAMAAAEAAHLDGPGRPILLSADPVGTLAGRLALAVSLVHGTAWALAPTPGELVGAFTWTRPTTVVAPSSALPPLLDAARAAGRWRRLRTLLTDEDDPSTREGWRELGVAVDAGPWGRLRARHPV